MFQAHFQHLLKISLQPCCIVLQLFPRRSHVPEVVPLYASCFNCTSRASSARRSVISRARCLSHSRRVWLFLYRHDLGYMMTRTWLYSVRLLQGVHSPVPCHLLLPKSLSTTYPISPHTARIQGTVSQPSSPGASMDMSARNVRLRLSARSC